jgi:hypothetical protein
MKCIKCSNDAKFKDRSNGRCPSCHHPFVFEPKKKDSITDKAFENSIRLVSSEYQIKWTPECLYYEVCRRLRKPHHRVLKYSFLAATMIFIFLAFFLGGPFYILSVVTLLITIGTFIQDGRFAPLDKVTFRHYLERWQGVNGVPRNMIKKRLNSKSALIADPDIVEYSFDRAVICDTESTVDLLLANNFHFENNCAVLTPDGYPEGPFETVRTMLRRNPRLKVFLLHDASVRGCLLSRRMKRSSDWFGPNIKVIDVGISPKHARKFWGFYQRSEQSTRAKQLAHLNHLSKADQNWLLTYSLELAVFRPEQIVKRLFKAMHHAEAVGTDSTAGDGGGSSDGDWGTGTSSDTDKRGSARESHESSHTELPDWGDGDTSDTDSDFDSFG